VSGLFVDDTGIWVSDHDGGRLLHLDPDTGSVVETIDVAGARGITAGFGSIWVASDEPGNARIVRIDPTNHSVVETIAVPGGVEFIAAGADAVWVTDKSSGMVRRIDPSTNSVSAEIDTGLRIARFVLVAAGKVWVNGSMGTGYLNGLLTIDPATNTLSRFIDTVPAVSWWIAELDGSIWATHFDLNEVVRIEPAP
jgi:streptogramin lyase